MKKTEVVEFFGTVRSTAKALGISATAIHLWGDDVPKSRRQAVIDAAGHKINAMQKKIFEWNT